MVGDGIAGVVVDVEMVGLQRRNLRAAPAAAGP